MQYILDTLVDSLATPATQGYLWAPRSKVRAIPKRDVDNSESTRLRLVEHASGKIACVPLLSVLFGSAIDGQIIGYMAEKPPRQEQSRSSAISNSTSIQGRLRCQCWRRSNNMFHRHTALLDTSAFQIRTVRASSSFV